jgi:CMP-N-acetylneuraminic acid synthetase
MIFSQISIPVILPRRFVIDIDTQEDWEMAESMMAYMKNGDKVPNNE